MADWVWVESAGATLEEEPAIQSVQFGDGYEQRSADGINHMRQVWVIPFDEVDDLVADDMIQFLRDHKGYIAFNYVPLRSTAAIRVVCKQWSRSHNGVGTSSMRATFRQDFAP